MCLSIDTTLEPVAQPCAPGSGPENGRCSAAIVRVLNFDHFIDITYIASTVRNISSIRLHRDIAMEDRARTRMSPYFADPPSPTPSSQSLGEDVVVTGHPSSIPFIRSSSGPHHRSCPAQPLKITPSAAGFEPSFIPLPASTAWTMHAIPAVVPGQSRALDRASKEPNASRLSRRVRSPRSIQGGF